MESEPLLDSLRSAVTAMPDDVPLRLHLASLLLRAGQRDEAVRHLGAVLQRDPGNGEALALLTGQHPSAPADPAVSPERTVAPAGDSASSPAVADPADDGDAPVLPTAPPANPAPAAPPAPQTPAAPPAPPAAGAGEDTASYDWSQAEDELRDVLPAMFVGDAGPPRPLTRPARTTRSPRG